MKDKVYGAVDTARPYVDRITKDDELHEHVKAAYASARTIYDELIGGRSPQALASRVAKDKDIQDELKKAVEELRKAGERVQGKESHTKRNAFLLLTGITLGPRNDFVFKGEHSAGKAHDADENPGDEAGGQMGPKQDGTENFHAASWVRSAASSRHM